MGLYFPSVTPWHGYVSRKMSGLLLANRSPLGGNGLGLFGGLFVVSRLGRAGLCFELRLINHGGAFAAETGA